MKTDLQGAIFDRQAIHDLVYQCAALLDDENFEEWVKLFDEAGVYELCAYSPEIRRWMSWWKSDRSQLAARLKQLSEHVRDLASRRHIVGAPFIEVIQDRATVVCPFAVYRTAQDGQSSLFMVGRYEDTLIKSSGTWRYGLHKAIADTRILEVGTHIPV